MPGSPSLPLPPAPEPSASWLATYYALWFTPSFSLSLLLERERGSALFRLLDSLSWLLRTLTYQPSILGSALSNELRSRPLPFNASGELVSTVISANTLRVVDHALYSSSGTNQKYDRLSPIYPDELAASLGIEEHEEAYLLLQESVTRVLQTYELVDALVARAELSFAADGTDDAELRELFKLLKPEMELSGMVTKQWQEIGFQLDALLYFAREYGERAVQITDEAVNGGLNWYPFALASIHMSAFALDMASKRDLQLLLLRSLQAPSSGAAPDTTPFLRVATDLLLLFHAHWIRNGFTVMQFEAVSKDFQNAVRPWARRGVLDGRALGWIGDVKKRA
ncbi:hypothetical protein RQP46_000587 [Phenoliferia psychrophenolica]